MSPKKFSTGALGPGPLSKQASASRGRRSGRIKRFWGDFGSVPWGKQGEKKKKKRVLAVRVVEEGWQGCFGENLGAGALGGGNLGSAAWR